MRLTTHANKSARAIVKLVEKATKRELGLDDCMAIAAHIQEAINAAQPSIYRMEKARADDNAADAVIERATRERLRG